MHNTMPEQMPANAVRRKPKNSLSAHGEPMVWATGGALSLCLFMIIGLLGLVLWQGLSSFWPRPVVNITTTDGQAVMGTQTREESYLYTAPGENPEDGGVWMSRRLIRTGNFDISNTHFRWVSAHEVAEESKPEWAMVVERYEWGRFYGMPLSSIRRQARVRSEQEIHLEQIVELIDDYQMANAGNIPERLTEIRNAALESMKELGLRQSREYLLESPQLPGLKIGFVLQDGQVISSQDYDSASIIIGTEIRAEGPDAAWDQFREDFDEVHARSLELMQLQKDEIGEINARLESARIQLRSLAFEHGSEIETMVKELAREQETLFQLSRLRTKWDSMLLVAGEAMTGLEGGAEEFRNWARTRLDEIDSEIERLENAQAEGKRRIAEVYGSRVGERAMELLMVQHQAQRDNVRVMEEIEELREENRGFALLMETAGGVEKEIALSDIVRVFPANQLSFLGKTRVYLSRWKEYLTQDPREANSEGGVYPAIIGTVVMTLLMAFAVVPFGVIAALYLREYAKAGAVVSAIRIAINNLAGVPSIVFGVFGLGFFCYLVGGYVDGGPTIELPKASWFALLGGVVAIGAAGMVLLLVSGRDRPGRTPSKHRKLLRWISIFLWLLSSLGVVILVATTPFFDGFYRASLPNPTFGKGALIWASFTLALLTLPVVIVATEEALSAVPNSMREGSYACGASKWQTIKRIVLPRAMPGIMTGMILAMARGAGEVAPLMLVGAVKLAPELPIAATPPFGLNRSFMHLGFHIYDLGFQSQNSEAAKPMVFTTTLLLVTLIAFLNILAVWLRNRLRKKFKGSVF
jgi:ABC-type phosphate transport system permease subunit